MTVLFDGIGRRQRLTPQSTGKRVTPQDRDLLWFAKLAEHGPLPSSFLLQYTQHMHRSEKRARERLTDLFNEDNTPDSGPYLSRPPQQFRTLDSRYNQLVYDLTPASKTALHKAVALVGRSSAPSGPWLHRFMVSCITASIELATLERGDLAYIPQSAILARAKADLRYPVAIIDPKTNRALLKDLIPDAVFGLEYRTKAGSRYRFFAVEADRATEPATSTNFNRKSFQRSVQHYAAYIEQGGYRTHLSLSAPMLVLHVTTDEARMAQMLRATARLYPSGNAYMLFQCWNDFGGVFRPPEPKTGLIGEAWSRAFPSPMPIDRHCN